MPDIVTVERVPLSAVPVMHTTAQEIAARIADQASAQEAANYLRGLRTRIAAVKAHYKTIRAKVRASLDDIAVMERQDLSGWVEAETLVGGALLAWQVAEEDAAKARNAARLAEAEARATVIREEQLAALAAAAEAAEKSGERKAFERQAKALTKAPLYPVGTAKAEAAPKLDGVSGRTTYHAEITDEHLLIAAVIAGTVPASAVKPNQVWLNEQATALGEALRYPGVTVIKDRSLTTKRVR